MSQITRSYSRGQIAGGASAAFTGRAGGALLMLMFQVLLARRLGVSAAGRFYLVLALISVVAVVGRFGTDQLVLRMVSVRRQQTGVVAEAYRASIRLAAALLALLSVLLVLGSSVLATTVFHDPTLTGLIVIGAVGILPFGLVAIQGEAIKGLGRPGLGSVIQSVVAPAVSLAALVSLPHLRSTTGVVILQVVGLATAWAVGEIVWRLLTHSDDASVRSAGGAVPRAEFVRACTPFFGASAYGLVLAWGPVLALGMAGRMDDTAAYFAAERWTAVASMVLVAVNGSVGPHFARLWAVGNAGEFARLLRVSTLSLGIAAVALFAATVVLAEPMLGVFGEEFGYAAPALRVLAFGQLVVLAGGPVTIALVMAGHERAQAQAGRVASAASVALLIVLVPGHSLKGAAVAATIALVLNKGMITVALRGVLSKEVDGGVLPGRLLPGEIV